MAMVTISARRSEDGGRWLGPASGASRMRDAGTCSSSAHQLTQCKIIWKLPPGGRVFLEIFRGNPGELSLSATNIHKRLRDWAVV
jgi:hypothetical protein